MDLTHVHAFAAAMQRKELDAMLAQMAESVVLKTPLLAAPLEGKDAVRPVVATLLRVVDAFVVEEILEGPRHAASFFTVTVGTERLDGMDYWLLNEAGLIQEMTVLWRPLPAIATVQRLIDAAG